MLLESSTLMLLGALIASAPLTPASTRALAPDSLTRVTLHIEGMTCGGCTLATRKVLTRLPGVVRADVTYEPQQALVTYDPAKVTPAQMIAAVKTLNYTATVIGDPKAPPAKGAPTGPAPKV